MNSFRSFLSDPHSIQPHIMPSPSNIPWDARSMPWTVTPAFNGVMEFNAPQLNPFGEKHFNHHKRKSDIVPPLPTKQFITEEKMAAHLNGLHISSEYVSHDSDLSGGSELTREENPSDILMDENEPDFSSSKYTIPMTSKELEEKLKNASRITFCEEIMKLNDQDTIIPKALMSRPEKPCKALILWQPPLKLTDIFQTSDKIVSSKADDNEMASSSNDPDEFEDSSSEEILIRENNNNNNNNNTSNLDLNCITMDTDLA